MSHFHVRQNGVGPGECVDGYRDLVAQWEEAALGNKGLEHTEPLAPSFSSSQLLTQKHVVWVVWKARKPG